MKRKTLLTIPLATLAALAIASPAAASTLAASGTCQQGVAWQVNYYSANKVNSVTVTIDGTVRYQDLDFGASDAGVIATDKTTPHTWSVAVNATGLQYDKALSGSYPACETAPPTTTVASSTTVVTTTLPAATDPATTTTTTTVVAVGIPPVPSTVLLVPPVTIAAGVAEEPALPRTGLDGTIVLVGAILVIGGAFLVLRGRRVG